MSDIDGDEVRLSMPASPHLLRFARLTAAGLAGRLGFSFDEIEDVKIAVDELCFALVGSKGRLGTLSLRYLLDADSLTIEGSGPSDGGPGPEQTEFSSQILNAVVDEHALSQDGDELRFRLLKRRGS
jgi:anti-sigma regulatory factor (Ser/Thr protein kinase)